MKIVVDMQGLQSLSSKHRGVGRYTRSLIKAIAKIKGDENQLVLAANGLFDEAVFPIKNEFSPLIGLNNIHIWQQKLTNVNGYTGKNSWRRQAMEYCREYFLNSLNTDIIWSTNLQEGLHEDIVTSVKKTSSNALVCTTLHDVVPLMAAKTQLTDPFVRKWYYEKLEHAKKSDIIFTDSNAAKLEILKYLNIPNERVFVIECGYDEDIFHQKKEASQPNEKFILYTGGADEHKNLKRLVLAYCALPQKIINTYTLVLAGKDVLHAKIKINDLLKNATIASERVKFTGYISDTELANLYQTCSLFIFPSLYEGFGLPPLEAMACGAAVIGSNTSSIPEVIGLDEALFDPFDIESITSKINEVLCDDDLYKKLKANALTQSAKFSWDKSAEKALQIFRNACLMKSNYGNNAKLHMDGVADATSLLREIAEIDGQPSHEDLFLLSQSISQSFKPTAHLKTIYLDISALIIHDHATGIQRVVRAIVHELSLLKAQYKFLPIYSRVNENIFYAANTFTKLNDNDQQEDCVVDFYDGDILLYLDLHPANAVSKKSENKKLMAAGVSVFFIVYDLLPVLLPHMFWSEFKTEFEGWLDSVMNSNGAICISKSVADELSSWAKEVDFKREVDAPFKIDFFHLGANIDNSRPSAGMPKDSLKVLDNIKEKKSFLMVGTVEPRKGHNQVLNAFELLWKQNIDINLVIVGKEGWHMTNFVKTVLDHPEYSRRLIWLNGISDEYLEKVYAASTCLIAASEGEGFGLPLIEAAQHQLPIIARDIPVFKEVAGEHAFYFEGLEPEDLSHAISAWLDLNHIGQTPESKHMPWLTWKQSTEQLLSALLKMN